jgi:lantibiotic biosynthesis protein
MDASWRPSGFFVLRAPLLPLEELDRLRSDPTYWRTLAGRPDVHEALHLASPGLMRSLAAKPDDRVAAAVIAYLVRMCTRATPFGLFAGCAVGELADATALVVDGPEGTTRHSRPDTEVLASLVERLLADPMSRPAMVVEPNSSRYLAAGAMRLIESRMTDGARTHHLMVIEDDPPLRCALDAASGGQVLRRVVDAVEAHAGVERQEATGYVDALVDAQVLTPVAEPVVTGPEPLTHVITSLAEQGMTATAEALSRVSGELARLDAAGLANPPEAYDAVAASLLDMAGGGDDARLVQVDLHRAGSGLTLGRDTVQLLTNGVHLLHRLSQGFADPALRRFKTAFRDRYEDREVALMEALDEEIGIGFDPSTHPAADESPLLAGVDLGGEPPEAGFTAHDAALLDLLVRGRDAGDETLELDPETVARLAPATPLPLPDAFAVFASLLEDGVVINGAYGPSGGEILGRFCHGDPRLNDAVRAHLRAEEACTPGVVYAEIVHLPEGRIGNILARPVLRDYELVLLGRSGAPANRHLYVDELTLRLERERFVLYSPRLGAEVRPRMTTAHNPAWRGFGVYRFLAMLQGDGVAGSLGWDWGALAGAPTLPRVTAGRIVLARARWRLSAAELAAVSGPDATAGWATLRRDRGLPDELTIVDGDNRLYVDTASPALTAAAAKVLKGRREAVVDEVLPIGVAAGPAGRFNQEVIVPFIRVGGPAPNPRPWRAPRARRSFAPGSEWLYLKAYTGTATADRILTDVIGPVIADLVECEVVDRWFFLRYTDPDHHLRIRLHGEPAVLLDRALPVLTDALASALADGTIWKVCLDTYQRETERYGGDAGIELAERIHAGDSDAVLEVLGMLDEDQPDARWQLCLYAIDRLLADAGLDVAQRRDWAKSGASGYRREYPNAPKLAPGIAARWRIERSDVNALLDDDAEHPFEPARQVFRRRSEQIAPLLSELADRSARGEVTETVPDLLHSFAHLHAIRLLRSAARTHELVLLSFLDRSYASRIARAAG